MKFEFSDNNFKIEESGGEIPLVRKNMNDSDF